MKQMNNYISEKLHINKDSKFTTGDVNMFDHTYKDIYELVDDLNEFFGDKLVKPIKVVNTKVVFRPDGPFGNSGIYVKEHFTIEFKHSATKIRCGLRSDTGLHLQLIFKLISGKVKYGWMMPTNQCPEYHFGRSNFLEWLIDIVKIEEQKALAQYFNLDEYITEKLHISKDIKTDNTMRKGITVINSGGVKFKVIDFISCNESDAELIKFLSEWDETDTWSAAIKSPTELQYFTKKNYEYLIAVKRGDKSQVFYFGGENKGLRYAED